ncbi:hypothetical protein [Idiomarina xiamenensis]|uniref:Adhesin domain-containing protein n=1 Tax=Idiomarina xiamenensis 10-D-4 TaxID=740709 RepID=K2L4Z9_9GAMM|nr:hypothetical protein [Idiomarina xiamenensis]EKE84895.1 hypothetical protein A10D4_04765 [Idiomarina xiamenensis 10-D-4]
MKKWVWSAALMVIGSVTLVSAAVAKDNEQREISAQYEFSAGGEMIFDGSVGEVTFVYHDDDSVDIQLTAEQSDGNWFGWNDGDVEALELVVEQQGNRIDISTENDDDLELTWVISMPRLSRLKAELGVGAINGDIKMTDIDMEVGVGQIDVRLLGDDYERIMLDSGVGDTQIKGVDKMSSERAMVSSESRSEGQGKHRVKASSGVGEVIVTIDKR